MAIYPYQYINKMGIPTIKSTGVSVGTDVVTFNFNADTAFGNPFRGLLLVYLADAIPSGTTTTLTIRFTSTAGTQAVTVPGGGSWTVADITGTGVFLVYYDRRANTLQVVK